MLKIVFDDYLLGKIILNNCIVMVFMMWSCVINNIFNEFMVEYYGQCVGVGFIIMEGIVFLFNGFGYVCIFGIYSDE